MKTGPILWISISILLLCLGFHGCRAVVNRAAFHPDKRSIPVDQLPQGLSEVFIDTEDGIQLQCYLLDHQNSEKIVIYFHGNAGNLSHRIQDLQKLHQMGVSVLGVSYRGYGKSQGSPNEAGVYKDGMAALQYVREDLGYMEKDIYLLGRSIGTTVAIHIAQDKKLAGLVLVTPLTSGKALGLASGMGPFSVVAGSAFNNIGKVDNIKCPVLVLHGTADRVIPYEMGVKIHQLLSGPKKMVTLEGAGHNNLSTDYHQQYWAPISEFLTQGI
jgi:fermentation-respiration switch protein FrsA (DUF1100 family)